MRKHQMGSASQTDRAEANRPEITSFSLRDELANDCLRNLSVLLSNPHLKQHQKRMARHFGIRSSCRYAAHSELRYQELGLITLSCFMDQRQVFFDHLRHRSRQAIRWSNLSKLDPVQMSKGLGAALWTTLGRRAKVIAAVKAPTLFRSFLRSLALPCEIPGRDGSKHEEDNRSGAVHREGK